MEKKEKFQELLRRMKEKTQEIFGIDAVELSEKLETLVQSITKDMQETFKVEEISLNQEMEKVEKQVQCLTEGSQTRFVFKRGDENIPLLTYSDEGWIVESRILRDSEMIYALIYALAQVLWRRKAEELLIKLGVGA